MPVGRQPPGLTMRLLLAKHVLPRDRRQEIFRLLVTAQDLEMTLAESRQMVIDTCGLTEGQIIQIEEEGLASNWPPL